MGWHLTETRSLLWRSPRAEAWRFKPRLRSLRGSQLPLTATLSPAIPVRLWGMNRPYGEMNRGCKVSFLNDKPLVKFTHSSDNFEDIHIKIHYIKLDNSKIAFDLQGCEWLLIPPSCESGRGPPCANASSLGSS